MPRRATGQVMKRTRTDSTVYALRFNANGQRLYVTLGSSRDGWNQAKAQDQLEHELACVEAGTWTPPEPESAPAVESDPTFHDFASEWFDSYRAELRPTTQLDYEWQLSDHLLPFFKGHRLSQITIAEVDRYRAAEGQAGQALGNVDQQDDHAARANPGGCRRVRADRAQPGPRQAAQAESHQKNRACTFSIDRIARARHHVAGVVYDRRTGRETARVFDGAYLALGRPFSGRPLACSRAGHAAQGPDDGESCARGARYKRDMHCLLVKSRNTKCLSPAPMS